MESRLVFTATLSLNALHALHGGTITLERQSRAVSASPVLAGWVGGWSKVTATSVMH